MPDTDKTLAGGAIAPWAKASKTLEPFYQALLEKLAAQYKVSLDLPWSLLPETFRTVLLEGSGERPLSLPSLEPGKAAKRPFEGVLAQLQALYEATESEAGRQRLRQFMGLQPCPTCEGARLRPELLAVKLTAQLDGANGKTTQLGIAAFCGKTIEFAQAFIQALVLD